MPLNRQSILSMIRVGKDGNSILKILDVIVEEYQQQIVNDNQQQDAVAMS
jgi:hypothetical protein|tara:strand:+ start:639 stop:788 length:150 start_codon:yes stop_codon:yes gene_type:complete